MWRLIAILGVCASPLSGMAAEALYPNKPGKKLAEKVVIGARIGPSPDQGPRFVVGAGGALGSGTGDYGFVGPETPLPAPKLSGEIGYRPEARFANKAPGS